jgi:hypothetical protein
LSKIGDIGAVNGIITSLHPSAMAVARNRLPPIPRQYHLPLPIPFNKGLREARSKNRAFPATPQDE